MERNIRILIYVTLVPNVMAYVCVYIHIYIFIYMYKYIYVCVCVLSKYRN